MNQASAGWYADAQREGHERWFDGGSWTEERRPVRASPPNPPTAQPVWIPAATAFVALLVVLCGEGLVLAGAVLDACGSGVSSG